MFKMSVFSKHDFDFPINGKHDLDMNFNIALCLVLIQQMKIFMYYAHYLTILFLARSVLDIIILCIPQTMTL